MIGLGLAASILLMLIASAVVLLVVEYREAADYPGGLLVADHNLYRLIPRPAVRRDTSYRTSDEFPIVYNWYSSHLELGPEVRAQSACILMDRGSEWLIFQRHTSVTVCDTPNGRMVFVMRSVTIR